MSDDKKPDFLAPLNNADPEIQQIVKRVLKLERDRLYQQRPHINSDIMQIIKEEIR